jgi:hypothetical protein
MNLEFMNMLSFPPGGARRGRKEAKRIPTVMRMKSFEESFTPEEGKDVCIVQNPRSHPPLTRMASDEPN